jgi:addiction module RelE/StbE family toxin
MTIKWTNEAKKHLQHIRDYIARDSVANANTFVKKLIAAPDQLIQFPQSGRMIPELQDPEKREVLLGNYRIMYHVVGGVVYITQVRHAARQFP